MAQTDRTTGLVGNAALKVPCDAATTANITLSGEQTIDGVACVDGDRVLVKDQTDQTDNGIYVVDTGAWDRAKDFDGVHDVVKGTLVMVTAGTTNINTYWRVTTADTVDIDTDNITFEQAYMSDMALATFLQAGTGAVSRTGQAKMRDIVSAADFGTLAQAVAAAAGKILYLQDTTYALAGTTLTLPAGGIHIIGQGRDNSDITYSGAGTAIDGWTNAVGNLLLEGFSVTTTDVAATAIKLGGGVQHLHLHDVALTGDTSAANTGTGLLLDATNPGVGTAFSGHLSTNLLYTLGYKHGIRVVGVAVGDETWTTMTFVQTFLIGRAAGIIAGSTGLSFDANTNGTGSIWLGGTIESFATGLSIANGSYGIEYFGDIEGCTTAYSVGASFQGRIELNPASDRYHAGANTTTNVWFKERHLSGEFVRETYYSQKHVIHLEPSGAEREWSAYLGDASIVGGGAPTFGFGFVTNGVFTNPESSYMRFGAHKMSWGSAAPTAGTWTQGDVVWNTGAAAAGSPGWVCTTGGTPGTWKTMANVAA